MARAGRGAPRRRGVRARAAHAARAGARAERRGRAAAQRRLRHWRALRPGGALYIHTPNRWACFEGHYKLFWLPGLPRPLAAGYLALRGRPTGFLRTLRPLTLAECRALVEAAGARVTRVLDDGMNRPVGGPLWPLVRAYYLLFGVRPYVELVATRGKAP